MVACFDSPGLGKYLNVSIRWDSYVSILDDLSAHLNWDSEPTEFEEWDSGSSGKSVGPRYSHTHRHDRAFIADLLVLRQPWNQKGKGGEVWSGRPGC